MGKKAGTPYKNKQGTKKNGVRGRPPKRAPSQSAGKYLGFRQTTRMGRQWSGGNRAQSRSYEKLALRSLSRDMCPSWVYNADKFMDPVFTGNNLVNKMAIQDFASPAAVFGIQAFDYREYLTQEDVMNYIMQSLNVAAKGGNLDLSNPGYLQLSALIGQGNVNTWMNNDNGNVASSTSDNTTANTGLPYQWGSMFNNSTINTLSATNPWNLMRYNFCCESYSIRETYTNQTSITAYLTVSEWVPKRAAPQNLGAVNRATQISGSTVGGYSIDGFNIYNCWIQDLKDTMAGRGKLFNTVGNGLQVAFLPAPSGAPLVDVNYLPTMDDTAESTARHNSTFSEVEDLVFRPGYHPSPKGKCVGTFFTRLRKRRVVLKPGDTYTHIDNVGGFTVKMGTDIMFYDKLLRKTRIHCITAYGDMGVESSAALQAGQSAVNYVGDRMGVGPIKLNRKVKVNARFRLLPFTVPTTIVRDGFGLTDWQNNTSSQVTEATTLLAAANFGQYAIQTNSIAIGGAIEAGETKIQN